MSFLDVLEGADEEAVSLYTERGERVALEIPWKTTSIGEKVDPFTSSLIVRTSKPVFMSNAKDCTFGGYISGV